MLPYIIALRGSTGVMCCLYKEKIIQYTQIHKTLDILLFYAVFHNDTSTPRVTVFILPGSLVVMVIMFG